MGSGRMLSALLLSFVLFWLAESQQCQDQSWLLPGNSPPLDPKCEYDGSLVPDCQLYLTDETSSYYHVHQYDCSKFWQCSPSGACLLQCPECPPGQCGDSTALSFDCQFQAPLGPVCDWPDSVNCSSSGSPCQEECCSDQDCPEEGGVCQAGSCQSPTTVPSTTTTAPTVCLDGWTEYSGNCYKYVDQRKNWEDARESCVTDYQAELISIHDQGESEFALSLWKETKFWTGGHRDCDHCETWLWSDGSSWDFTNWREGREPNNNTGPESCAEIGHYQDSWNDWKCGRTIHYVCKKVQKPASCAEGWTELNDNCYLYVEDRMTWADAEASCNEREAHLVSIGDQAENALVLSLAGGSKVWLGGRSSCPGCADWTWTDGRAWAFTNWAGPEPNNAGGPEDCLEMGHYASARDQWNDWSCNNKIPFICHNYKH